MPLNFFNICTYGGYCLRQKIIYIYNHAIKLPIKTLYQIFAYSKSKKKLHQTHFHFFCTKRIYWILNRGKKKKLNFM